MSGVTKFLGRGCQTPIEAARLSPLNIHILASWTSGHQVPHLHTQDMSQHASLHVYGRKQMYVARHGDWVVKHPEDGMLVMSDEEFDEKFVAS
jgi:hypothetical protein